MTDYDTNDKNEGAAAVVILRGCTRCGGDILTGDAKNVRCLQCGHAPKLSIAELRRRSRRGKRSETPKPFDVDAIFAAHSTPHDALWDFGNDEDADSRERCPRCEETDSIALEKLRPHFNTCYRCRLCGHIFSPALFKAAS